MLETREKVVSQLSELKTVRFHKPTARELHSQRNHLVQRVGRQENRRYREQVEKQKVKLKDDLRRIDEYLLSLNTARLDTNGVVPLVEVPQPEIGRWGMPLQRRARFQKRARAKGLTRLR